MKHYSVWPGPMEGVMTPALIRAASHLALVQRWMTPFLRVSGCCPRLRKLEEFFAPFNGTIPVSVQLMGTEPEPLAQAAAIFASLGAAEINLNFGCPSRQVISGGAGGGALRNPAAMLRIVQTVKAAIPATPLSVKLRTGYSDPAEQQLFLPALAATGCIDRFFIHFRTVTEQYRSIPGREQRLAQALKLAAPVPAVVNGDINTSEDARKLLALLPDADGAMCARGWLRDPYLLRRISGFSAPEPEEGRELFFRCVVGDGFPVNKSIELSNFIWGKEANPYFASLLQHPKGELFTISHS